MSACLIIRGTGRTNSEVLRLGDVVARRLNVLRESVMLESAVKDGSACVTLQIACGDDAALAARLVEYVIVQRDDLELVLSELGDAVALVEARVVHGAERDGAIAADGDGPERTRLRNGADYRELEALALFAAQLEAEDEAARLDEGAPGPAASAGIRPMAMFCSLGWEKPVAYETAEYPPRAVPT